MQPHDTHDELIATLGSLKPTSGVGDPLALALAFEAGRRSAARSATRWRIATGAVALFALMATLLPHGDSNGVGVDARDRLGQLPPLAIAPVSEQVESVIVPPSKMEAENVVSLRDAVLSGGLDALPQRAVPGASGRPMSAVGFLMRGDL